MVRFTARGDELPYYMIQFKGSEESFEINSSQDEDASFDLLQSNSTFAYFVSPWKFGFDQFDVTGQAVKKDIHFVHRNYKISANGETSPFLRIRVYICSLGFFCRHQKRNLTGVVYKSQKK